MEEFENTNGELKAEVLEKVEQQQEEIREEMIKNNRQERFEKQKREWEDMQEQKEKRKSSILKWLIPTICVLVALVILSTGFALINSGNEKIIAGVSIDKIKMQGLSKEEAMLLLQNKIEEKLNNEVEITVDNEKTSIVLNQIDLKYLVDEAVKKAQSVGRDSNILVNNYNILKSRLIGTNIEMGYTYNEEQLNSLINELNSKIPNAVKQVSYNVEDDELIITRGIKGLGIDKKELENKIKNIITLNKNEEISLKTMEINPEEIDIEKIYEDVHTEPKDAYYTTNPFQVYPEVVGVDFNIEEAKKILEEEKEEYVIPLTITKPSKTVNDIGTEAFPDFLSKFTTRYDESNVSRSTNLKIAIGKINGTVVMPGETFSYNKTVGKRTAEAGYKDAAGYEGGKVVQMLGGGICQVSSTLYDAVVYANLGIVERHNHAFLTSYVGAGKDATVVYGSLDFKFKNTRSHPITIKASANNGIATVEIYGFKEETEYKVDISTTILNYTPFTIIYEDNSSLSEGVEKVTQGGMNGCKSITYKILKLNDKEVSREVLSNDTYNPMNKYITRGTKKTTPVVTEPVTPSEPVTPTEPTEPVTPEEPVTPVEPEEPVTPAEPTEPTEPVTPDEPVTPGDENTEP